MDVIVRLVNGIFGSCQCLVVQHGKWHKRRADGGDEAGRAEGVGAGAAPSSPHLYCRFLVRFSRSACPEEYCSITSFTS